MIPMRIHQVSMDSIRSKYTVLLQDSSGTHKLTLPLGSLEAKLLTFVLTNKSLPFPLMHEIMLETLSICGGTLKSVTIDEIKDNAFIAHILIEHTTKQICFACKPTDAMLIALKNKIPIKIPENIIKDFSNQLIPHNIKPDDIKNNVLNSPVNSLWDKALSQIKKEIRPPIISTDNSPNLGEEDKKMLDLLLKLDPASTRKM